MLRFISSIFIALLFSNISYAKTDSLQYSYDSLSYYDLEEVIIIAPILTASDKVEKPLSSMDQYLSKNASINMIRRGSYAWEPYIHGMSSERSIITIDGMRIYGACTDKMDPVTSYVEIFNLSSAKVSSGHASTSGGGSTIAGGLDLVKMKGHFGNKHLMGASYLGFETNNLQKVMGTSLSYSHPKTFIDLDFTYRDANNYKAGGKKEVEFSQFTKYNLSTTIGYNINTDQHIEAAFIYDHAVDVGYPALPMDVSTAKAFIGSLEHFYHPKNRSIQSIRSKVYFNNITHIMDDSEREDVAIRMDMPGWSKTGGFYTNITGQSGKNRWRANFNAHHHNALAEMTMYPNDPNGEPMFMLTWPDVSTNYFDLSGENSFKLSNSLQIGLQAGMALHHNSVDSEFGRNSLAIFYPDFDKNKVRWLKRANASVQYNKDYKFFYNGQISYGDRALSVSEGYGFYLFNSSEKYDYIGNPNLSNEKSVSTASSIQYLANRFSFKLAANYFYMMDYIIGKPDPSISPMTIGAAGVKVYEQVQNAHIFNASLDVRYEIIDNLHWDNTLIYRRGKSKHIGNLPTIQPFSYRSQLEYSIQNFSTQLNVQGSIQQRKINPDFGELELPAFTTVDLSASYYFDFQDKKLILKAGVENLLDKHYTTFADWNRIPQMGRNFFFNLVWKY